MSQPMMWRKSGSGSIEPAPEHSDEFLGQFAEALPDPALVLSGRGIVLAANGLARETLGLDPAGQHLSLAIRAPDVLRNPLSPVASLTHSIGSLEDAPLASSENFPG